MSKSASNMGHRPFTPYFPERNWRLMLGENFREKRPAQTEETSSEAFPAQPVAPKGLLRYLKFHR